MQDIESRLDMQFTEALAAILENPFNTYCQTSKELHFHNAGTPMCSIDKETRNVTFSPQYRRAAYFCEELLPLIEYVHGPCQNSWLRYLD